MPIFIPRLPEMNRQALMACHCMVDICSWNVAPPAHLSRSSTIVFLLNSRGERVGRGFGNLRMPSMAKISSQSGPMPDTVSSRLNRCGSGLNA